MSTVLKSLSMLFFCVALFSLAACGDSTPDNQDAPMEEAVDKTGPEYTSAYICPMHCKGSGSDQPGTCPVCGMDYVKRESITEDDHSHDGHDHNGEDHDH